MPDIGLLQSSKPPRKRRRRETPAELPADAPTAALAEMPAMASAAPPLAIAASVIEVVPPAPSPPAPVMLVSFSPATPDLAIETPATAVAEPIVMAAPLAAAPEAPHADAIATAPPQIPIAPPPAPPVPAALEPLRASDLWLLGGAVLAIIGTGLGVRDPWPADEPRFAAIARDLVESGEWFFPRVGGDLYQDKPPVFFWLLALSYSLFGSVKASFLVPSFLSAAGVTFLVYDFGRRLVSRESGLAAALGVLTTLQFVLAMRGAQIDPTLCLLTTLSLYGFLRHLLLGPAWGWYTLAGFAAGLGIITKGVGFLPLLILLPYVVLRSRGWSGLAPLAGTAGVAGWRWWLAPLAMFAGVALWFVPMLLNVAANGSAEYLAYRDEILFKQTVTRYAGSWHHVKGWYYFLLEVIPSLWWPWTVLLVWLVPRWKEAWAGRDARVWLPLGWVLLVLLFFSLSAGKRGVYILPAVPALAFAALPVLAAVLARAGVRRAGFALAGLFVLVAVVYSVGWMVGARFAHRALAGIGLDSATPLIVFIVLASAALFLSARRAPLLAWPATLAALCLVFSYGIAPAMNGERSGSDFIRAALAKVRPGEELALVAYKEQFLLYLDRSTYNFGHRRSFEGSQEFYDAAAWLNAGESRVLLVPEPARKECFAAAAELAGTASRENWYLVRGRADTRCASQGNATRAIRYPSQMQ